MTRIAILRITAMRRCGAHRRLRDPKEFARVRLDREWGTLCWPGNLDFAPEALRDLPEETVEAKARRNGPRGHRKLGR